MRALRLFVIAAVASLTLIGTGSAEAGPAARIAKRSSAGLSRLVRGDWARIAKLDRAAHRAGRTAVLTAPVSVKRYVSRARAAFETKHGFRPWTHFTGPVRPGRPLSAATAGDRFGLRRVPQRVEKVTLPAGTRVKKLKVHGGGPGQAEWVLVDRLQRAAVSILQRVVK